MPPFDRSVFINCPFDEAYEPILQAVAFCVVFMGFHPRLAPEEADNAKPRLKRILKLIKGSKYGIHDLSRSRPDPGTEFARLNMPFELGLDFACRAFARGRCASKAILVLEHDSHDSKRALSDISGWDVSAHGSEYQKAVREVRRWLVAKAGACRVGPSKILSRYEDFQAWYWEHQRATGASDDDIKAYPTVEMIEAMEEWKLAEASSDSTVGREGIAPHI